jgi:phage-related minor tail protein
MAQKVEAAGQLAGDGFAKGLNRSQFMELGHSARATFDALAAGASPLRVLAMEGPRVVQALGQGGLGTTLGELAGKINPVILTLGGLGAALALARSRPCSTSGRCMRSKRRSHGLGRASGATIGQIQAIAEAQAAGGTITEGAVKKIETAMVTPAASRPTNLGEATTVVREFAQATHEKMAEASKDMAKAFADPAKGAHDLGVEYGLLGEKQVEEIRRIQEHEGRAAALKKLLEDLETELKRSGGALADHADGWAAVATAIGHAWENLGKFIASAPASPRPTNSCNRCRTCATNTPAAATPPSSPSCRTSTRRWRRYAPRWPPRRRWRRTRPSGRRRTRTISSGRTRPRRARPTKRPPSTRRRWTRSTPATKPSPRPRPP